MFKLFCPLCVHTLLVLIISLKFLFGPNSTNPNSTDLNLNGANLNPQNTPTPTVPTQA